LVDPKGKETLKDEAPSFLAIALDVPLVALKRLKEEMVQNKKHRRDKGWIQDRWFLTTTLDKPKNKKRLTTLWERF
jgi:hypothetical protein